MGLIRLGAGAIVALSVLVGRPEIAAGIGITSVTAGGDHTCALTATGGVKCWGTNEQGQLGCVNDTGRSIPGDVLGLSSGVLAVQAGDDLSCALTTAGGVKCWGSGHSGNGAVGTFFKPLDVLGLTSGVTAIAVGANGSGNHHACVVTTAGGVKCWGDNSGGQLGDGTTTPSEVPVDVVGISTAVAVTAGSNHTCALTSAGGLKCWGRNFDGELGNGSLANSSVPVDVTGLTSGVAGVDAGGGHTCAVTTGGGAKCWGSNVEGTLGDGTTMSSSVPVDVSGLTSGVSSVSTGTQHTCAVTTAGGAKCWGLGLLTGDGTSVDTSVPVDVVGLTSGVISIDAADNHTCVVLSSGGSRCWGVNTFGALGDGIVFSSSAPIGVSGLQSGVATVAVGAYQTCVVTTGGGAKCWGDNSDGQVGDGTSGNDRPLPVDVVGLASGVAQITVGADADTCALTTAGGVKCWGNAAASAVPVDVAGLTSGVGSIGAGYGHFCALTTSGGVKCWGANEYGQLGDGTTTPSPSPVDVSGLTTGVVALGVGHRHTCAVLTGGGVKCWGRGQYGKLGNDDTSDQSFPVDVVGLTDAVSVSPGQNHTCAINSAGGVLCWGGNFEGQLGDGKVADSAVPVQVSGLESGTASIRVGYLSTCAASTAGAVKCWGANGSGQIGDGTNKDRHKPTAVFRAPTVMAGVGVGIGHACAVTTSGAAICWGAGLAGALGIGGDLFPTTPVDVLLPGLCPPTPAPACRTATTTSLSVVEANGKRTTKWGWLHGQSTSAVEFGVPTTAGRYALCVYSAGSLALELEEVGWNCTKPSDCWKLVRAKGYKFANGKPNPQSVKLYDSASDDATILVKDTGAAMTGTALPLTAPVTAQLRGTTTSICWEATYMSGNIATTPANKFLGSTM